jgi:hypothetical protein
VGRNLLVVGLVAQGQLDPAPVRGDEGKFLAFRSYFGVTTFTNTGLSFSPANPAPRSEP